MRFKLILKVHDERFGNRLPINYQYELSAAIYRIMENSDSKYALWLHQNGYPTDSKRFKLFTFSRLEIPKYAIDRETQRLHILSDYVSWNLAFYPKKSTKSFVEGVFKNRIFQIGDKISAVEFEICEIQILPPLNYSEEMLFETISPVCITHREGNRTKYLSPDDELYTEGIITGLKARYKAISGHDFEGNAEPNFKSLGKAKSSLIKIKTDRPEQTFVKGYNFRFIVSLPEELMQIAYECGLGEKGSLGFGMIKQINK